MRFDLLTQTPGLFTSIVSSHESNSNEARPSDPESIVSQRPIAPNRADENAVHQESAPITTWHENPIDRKTVIDEHLKFLQTLIDGAPARVPSFRFADETVFADSSLTAFYRELEENRVQGAPHSPPPIDVKAAIWGGLVVHWACWMIVERSETNIQLPHWLHQVDARNTAAWQWSADLMLCVWPELNRRCKTISKEDPIRETIRQVAIETPLSAIGLSLDEDTIEQILSGPAWAAVQADSCLRRIARDRMEQHSEFAFDPARTDENP